MRSDWYKSKEVQQRQPKHMINHDARQEIEKGINSMMQPMEIPTDQLIRALRIYVNDINDKASPHMSNINTKGQHYLYEISTWIAHAATRLEKLSADKESTS